jgi:PTH2 family peptidyl-tRNA hydrolase
MKEKKQVLVLRKDLNMRKGKMVAQGAHASEAFLIHYLMNYEVEYSDNMFAITNLIAWLKGGQTKITVSVNSEDELMELYHLAKRKGLIVNLITDAGRTEFNGVPTRTCIAIGPNDVDAIDELTGHLPLL